MAVYSYFGNSVTEQHSAELESFAMIVKKKIRNEGISASFFSLLNPIVVDVRVNGGMAIN